MLGKFIFRKNSIYGTFWLTESTIDAFVGVYHEHVGALVEAVHWTHFYAVSVLALYTGLAYYEGHQYSSA